MAAASREIGCLCHPNSKVVTPYSRSSASRGAAAVYIRAVWNTGAKPCAATSATAVGFTAGMSSCTRAPAGSVATSARSRRSANSASSAHSGPILKAAWHGRATP